MCSLLICRLEFVKVWTVSFKSQVSERGGLFNWQLRLPLFWCQDVLCYFDKLLLAEARRKWHQAGNGKWQRTERGSSSLSPGGVWVGGKSQLLEDPVELLLIRETLARRRGDRGKRGGWGMAGVMNEQLKSYFHPFWKNESGVDSNNLILFWVT